MNKNVIPPKTAEDKKREYEKEKHLKETYDWFEKYQHPEANESFLHGPSKVEEVKECLDAIINANKSDSAKEKPPSMITSNLVTDTNFFVYRPTPQRISGTRNRTNRKTRVNTNNFTFMRQTNPDPEDRILARKEREVTAESFRRMGNVQYRNSKFESAVDSYTKGLQYINDTPVLYLNRALCYIKLREFKRSIMDTTYVITYLDEKYLRAWLYRAAAYKRLNDEKNFEYNIYQARRINYREQEFIDDFLDKMRSLL
ncbi:hypothetical protein KR009_011770 [Drosophila setifemur]|nr:hypothetical protein KR009_011770 [Drosophila setifemur]